MVWELSREQKSSWRQGKRKQNAVPSPQVFLSLFFPGGMQALFKVEDCKKPTSSHSESTKIRQYFLAAEEIIWNYGPSAVNNFTGQELIVDR